jgi:hypothetical protein
MAAMDSEFYVLLKFLAMQIPEMAAMLLGMVLALGNWGRYPRPAFLSFLGFGLLLAVTILFWVVLILLPRHLGLFAGNQVLDIGVTIVRSLLCAGAYLLLIFAIYAARKPRVPFPSYQSNRRIHELDR